MLLTNSAAIRTDATPSAELGIILGINQILKYEKEQLPKAAVT